MDNIYSAYHYACKTKADKEAVEEIAQKIKGVMHTVEGSVGDIGFAPLGIDESQNKRRYLNGQVISQSQFESFTNKVKAAIQLTPSLATSETNWQAEVTNSVNGTCGKFVIDDTAGTIRLPKYPEYVSKEYVESAVVGNGMTLGLTDGTYNYGLVQSAGSTTRVDTAKGNYGLPVGSALSGSSGEGSTSYGITTDPTKSGIVADFENAITETIPCKWFIQVATGVEESVDVTREIELNNPFSLLDYKWSEYEISNASWLLSNGAFHSGATYVAVYELLLKIKNGAETKDGVSVKLSTEAYEDTDFVINTAEQTFRLPIKVRLASGSAVVGNNMSLGLTDSDNNLGLMGRYSSVAGSRLDAQISGYGIDIGKVVSNTTAVKELKTVGITTDPAKSGIETSSSGLKLYFYVGETIQDANVIAASQVLTDVANLKAHTIIDTYSDNNGNWYRVYSDGWCEQGGLNTKGNTSITLLKPYKNTNYHIIFALDYGSGTTVSWVEASGAVTNNNRTTTGFTVGTRVGNWYACGYIA